MVARLEEIVGEIRDESEPEPDVVQESANSFLVSGNLDLDRLEEIADFRPAEDFESTTIGGLVTEQLGHVPATGAKVRLDGIEIEVLAADERHVKALLPVPAPSPPSCPTRRTRSAFTCRSSAASTSPITSLNGPSIVTLALSPLRNWERRAGVWSNSPAAWRARSS